MLQCGASLASSSEWRSTVVAFLPGNPKEDVRCEIRRNIAEAAPFFAGDLARLSVFAEQG